MTATIAQLGPVQAKTKTATEVVLDAAAKAGHTLTQVFGVGGGDHAGGLATDFMVYSDQAAGDWIADYVWANRGALGVRWIIWRQRIRSINPRGVYGPPNQWNAMENRGNPTQNHMDHVHVMWDSVGVNLAALNLAHVVGDIGSAVAGIYTVKGGDTLGAIASKFRVTVADLTRWNGIKNPNVISVGQKLRITAPTSSAAAKPKPAPTSGARPWLIPSQKGVYLDKLRPRVNASTSVYLYQLALRRYLNKYADKYNPSGATGNYGSETETMTGRVYLDLAKKAGPKRNYDGWLTDAQVKGKEPLPTWPGTSLLKALGLTNLGHS